MAGFKGLEGVTVARNGGYVYAAARGLTSDGPGVTTRLVRVPIQANGDPGPMERLTWGDDHVPGGVALDTLDGLGYSTRPGSGSIGTVAKRQPSGAVSQLASGLQLPMGVAYEAAGHLDRKSVV